MNNSTSFSSCSIFPIRLVWEHFQVLSSTLSRQSRLNLCFLLLLQLLHLGQPWQPWLGCWCFDVVLLCWPEQCQCRYCCSCWYYCRNLWDCGEQWEWWSNRYRDLLVIMKGKGSDDRDEEGSNGGPPGEAMVSMIICMIILTIFFIFFCLIPVYRCVVISRKF